MFIDVFMTTVTAAAVAVYIVYIALCKCLLASYTNLAKYLV